MRLVPPRLRRAILTAGGANGAPSPPAEPGISVSGQVKVGVGGSL